MNNRFKIKVNKLESKIIYNLYDESMILLSFVSIIKTNEYLWHINYATTLQKENECKGYCTILMSKIFDDARKLEIEKITAEPVTMGGVSLCKKMKFKGVENIEVKINKECILYL